MFNSAHDKTYESRHLAVVFFDILYLNGTSLLEDVYADRRKLLESVVSTIPTYSLLAKREEIIISAMPPDSATDVLQKIFSDCISRGEEGLILKASDGTYGDTGSPWIKVIEFLQLDNGDPGLTKSSA